MSALAVTRSSLVTSLMRYRRSWGLWLMLIVAPVGARYMISGEDGRGVAIAIGGHLPVLTPGVVGIWLGIVVSTLLVPVAYGYLRSNTNRRQPWQVTEVTAASRIAIALGRFAADAAILLLVLTALNVAGWFLAWLLVPGRFDPLMVSLCLWVVAAPSLIVVAALRILFDALPPLRGRLGDLAFFILWMMSIAMVAAIDGTASSFATNLPDFAGFYRPLVAGAPPSAAHDFAIGGVTVQPGRVPLDVAKAITAPGYLAARAAWVGIGIALAVLAGLLYRPHRRARAGRLRTLILRLLAAGPPRPAKTAAPAAGRARLPALGLVIAEMRLIGAGRLFLILAALCALLGLGGDYRHGGSAAGLLLLAFALSAHAGRSEARGLLALTRTAPMAPMVRRLAFVAAGTLWSLLLALPAAAIRLSAEPLRLGLMTGASAAITAMLLGALTRSAFTPRLVLLIGWYAYFSS